MHPCRFASPLAPLRRAMSVLPAASHKRSRSPSHHRVAPKSKRVHGPPSSELLAAYAREVAAHPDAAPSLEVRASHYVAQSLNEPCQLGVFACRRILEGERVCFYAGHISHKTDVKEMSHARCIASTDSCLDGLPTADLFTRFIPANQAAVDAIRRMPAADFLPAADSNERKLLNMLPIGCMINSPVGGRKIANTRIVWFHVPEGQGLPQAPISRFQATRDIEIGEELLGKYSSNEEKQWACNARASQA
jgi:hypothetical protein